MGKMDKLVICALAKNENAYINDWVKYHLDHGYDRIYLYDNNDKSDPYVGDCIDAAYRDRVVIYDVRGKDYRSKQAFVYNRFITKHCNNYEWCTFIDVDEFVVADDMRGLVYGLPNDFDCLALNWQVYGDDGVIVGDLIYDPDCWRTFEQAYEKHGSDYVYSFGMRRVGFPFLEQDFITNTGVYHDRFVVYSGWGLVFPPNLMRLERSDIETAFRVSPTCDDTYLSPYMISHGIGVCNLSGTRKNYKQRLPIGCNTLFNFNRTKYDRHIRDNFAHFGLTV